VARGESSLIVRILFWVVAILAIAVVSFFIGFLVGPYVIDHFFS